MDCIDTGMNDVNLLLRCGTNQDNLSGERGGVNFSIVSGDSTFFVKYTEEISGSRGPTNISP